jgi:diaminohydroxyphosphoribosylaminopyrimidine deaminase/5-amino-6-(5-phosphoribosylamino)uracil reductase
LATSARVTPVWVVTAPEASPAVAQVLQGQGVEVLQAPAQAGRLDLATALRLLAERGITRLMVEGGPTVAASFVAADLIDAAVLFHSTKALGADGIDALEGLPLEALTGKMTSLGREPVGEDSVEFLERA